MGAVGLTFTCTLGALGALLLGACERPLDGTPPFATGGASGRPVSGGSIVMGGRGGDGPAGESGSDGGIAGTGGSDGGFGGFGGFGGGWVDVGPSCGEARPTTLDHHVTCTASAPLARMPVPLFNLTAATAPDGRIFLVGGAPQYSTNPGVLYASVYDPATASFRALPSIPARAGGQPAAAFAGNKLIAVDGGAWRYDMEANCWTPIPVPRTLINRGAATGSDGRAYFFGGNYGDTNAAHAYDAATDQWETLPSMPFNGYAMGATEVDGRIYVVGLSTASFNLGTRAWTVLAAPPTPRYWLSAAPDAAGRVVAVGGFKAGGEPGQFPGPEIYDPKTDRWTTGTLPSVGVSQMGVAATCGGTIFTFGGTSLIGLLDVVQTYDPVTGLWRISP